MPAALFRETAGGGGKNTPPPAPELLEKDISGCMFAFFAAMARMANKLAEAGEKSEKEKKPTSSVDKALLQKELMEDQKQAESDYRKCLDKGKSMSNAMGEEFTKTSQNLISDKLKSFTKILDE